MSFFRSDPVGHYKLVIPRESAWHIMSMLGIDSNYMKVNLT
jgi:hypothetical protein